jgi:ankyrin repeat protein
MSEYLRDKKDAKKYTPLDLAIINGKGDAVRVLLAGGSAVDPERCIQLVLERHSKPDVQNSPQHYDESRNVLRALSDFNISLLTKLDEDGNTSLHVFAKQNNKAGIYLLAGLQVNVNLRNAAGNTPLHVAAANNSLVALETLTDLNADIWIQNKAGQTAVALAKACGHVNSEEYLETVSLTR